MVVNELHGYKVGDTVVPIVGDYTAKECQIEKIEKDAGAVMGWFTVRTSDGVQLLLTGNEIRRHP